MIAFCRFRQKRILSMNMIRGGNIKKIKNNDYYKSSDLKKLFERYDCNMNAIFEEWKK